MGRVSLKDRRDQASLYWLFALFALLPLTVAFGHRGLAPWLLLAAIPAFLRGDFWLAAFGALFDRLEPRDPFFAAFLSILFFCFWIFLSGFWSPRNMPSLALWVLAPVLVGGSVVWFCAHLTRVWAHRLAVAFAAAIVVGMGVLALEGVTGGALRAVLPPDDPTPNRSKDIVALGRGVTALAPALFPAGIIAASIWNRYAALAMLATGLAAAYFNDVSANAVALAAGLIAAVIAFKAPRATIMSLCALALAALIGAPLMAFAPVDQVFTAAGGGLPASWLHRLAIWQTAAERIPEGLPFGFGADFARVWNETAPMIDVPGVRKLLSTMPNHPHNLFLQIWLELGVPGVLAFGGFLFWGARAFARANPPRPVVAAAAGAFAAVFASTLVEGSLWQVWRFAAMALAAMGVGLAYSLHTVWARRK